MLLDNVQKEFKQRGTDLNKLMAFLTKPKYGIMPQVAGEIIKEVYDELEQGFERYKDIWLFPAGYRKLWDKGTLPEDFWLDNYVLMKCQAYQELISSREGIEQITPLNADDQFNEIGLVLLDISEQITTIYERILPICNFLSIPPYMKRAARWTKKAVLATLRWIGRYICFGWIRRRNRRVSH